MNPDRTTIEGFVLTGGASSRMGSDKALLMLDGEPMAAHLARLLSPYAIRVTLVGERPAYRHLG